MAESDRDIAKRALDFQARSRDYGMGELPGYMAWSERKLAEGESEAFIANLDAGTMWLTPESAAEVNESVYEEMLDQVKESIGEK